MNGIIFNIQHFCVNDGNGIRTTVFLKGCPLSCKWCHNPESQSFATQILFYKEKCTCCGRCRGLTVNDTDFTCFNGAKEICGKLVSADEVVAEVIKDKIFYANSGGGITLSGGEPLAQFDFSAEILKKSKENGIQTAIETCGYADKSKILEISEYTDLFLFDYKETDSALHKKYTGVSNESILENLKAINGAGKDIILRCPIIPGYNDRKEHFNGIAAIANSFEHILHIELEPYHPLGESKYLSLGLKKPEINTPNAEDKELWRSAISSATDKKVKFA